MEKTLRSISESAIQINESTFTAEQIKLRWLGTTPASVEEIISAERRLKIELPKDYKDFLLITNGFFTPADATEPTFEKVDRIDYLKNVDSFVVEVWNGHETLADVAKELARSIIVAGIDDEQYFLLIPPDNISEKWKYWKFASWMAGEYPYEDLDTYFVSVLDFLKRTS